MQRETKVQPHKAPMLLSMMAYLYAPLAPLLSKIHFHYAGQREHHPEDILVPEGYQVETLVTGLNAPVHCTFDEEGYCYVFESGHKIDAPPRILKVDIKTGDYSVFYEWPEERWHKLGAITGGIWHEGYLYVMNTGTFSRISREAQIEDLITGLRSQGDHQTNYPVLGPDGKFYFGQGTATNLGVVGPDNYDFEWLRHHPEFHDVPAHDITLSGENYTYQNVLGDVTDTVVTGAFVPFGTVTHKGQVVHGDVKCNGAILRCNPDGSDLEVFAWGFRNPYGTAFTSDGRLFCTEHDIDERSARYIVNDLGDFYEVQEGEWYGWPDFAAGMRLDDPYWGKGGQGRAPVMAEHPNPHPPKPRANFPPHAAPNGFDFSRDPNFGFEGWAFVALYGDLVPFTAQHRVSPVGFKVVRVNPETGEVLDFAVNKIAGPASKLPQGGFERPSHCQFGPDGALYVVDWGEIDVAITQNDIRDQISTGTVWRIRRNEEPRGNLPPKPVTVPLYLGEALALGGAVLSLAALGAYLIIRKRNNRG